MKRVFTATCLAATFAVGLAAQSTGTAGTAPQDPQAGGQRGGGPRTVTGCLRAGDTAGTFTLTDVVMPAGRMGGGGAGAGAAAGTPAGGTTAGAGGEGAGQTMPPMSINLTADPSVDLKAHVGHKIEATGTLAGGRGRGGADAGATGTATGTTSSGTPAGGTTGGTATATGTGSTSGTGTAGATGTGQGAGRGPRMTVTSIRMISESCSQQ